MDTLIYVAPPGQINLGSQDEPLVNIESCPVLVEGHAIPGHIDGDGHPYRAGFDIASLKIARPTEFVSSHAIVVAETGMEFHWRQVPQALQWADEQVGGFYDR
jgi:hypothetical protein